MWMEKCKSVDCFMEGLKKRNPGQPEFHQAVSEFVSTVMPFVRENPVYLENQILERMTEPDRVIAFRVTWRDDKGNIRVNRLGESNSTIRLGRTKAACGSIQR